MPSPLPLFTVDPEKHQELFSRAYVHAVVSASGHTIEFQDSNDDDSCDAIIKARGGPGPRRSPRIEIQLKATRVPVYDRSETNIRYPLKQKNYDDLIGIYLVPRILLLVVVPRLAPEWLIPTEESCLRLHHCCYWVSLAGFPVKSNKSTTTVPIPRSQRFTPSSLNDMLVKVAQESRP